MLQTGLPILSGSTFYVPPSVPSSLPLPASSSIGSLTVLLSVNLPYALFNVSEFVGELSSLLNVSAARISFGSQLSSMQYGFNCTLTFHLPISVTDPSVIHLFQQFQSQISNPNSLLQSATQSSMAHFINNNINNLHWYVTCTDSSSHIDVWTCPPLTQCSLACLSCCGFASPVNASSAAIAVLANSTGSSVLHTHTSGSHFCNLPFLLLVIFAVSMFSSI